MNICISWATWFLGQWLVKKLLKQDHTITILSRSKSKVESVFGDMVAVVLWDTLQSKDLEWIEAVIHLAGAPLFRFPWSTSYKKTIYNSRIHTTRKLVAVLPESCHIFLCWSAVWYYPSSEEIVYDETYCNNSPNSFLENVCIDREREAMKANAPHRRVVLLRTSIVEWDQWIRKKILQATKWFGWVILGSWDQYLSLITDSSRCNKVIECMHTPTLTWPVNLVDRTITMKAYIREIAQQTQRPVWRFTIPDRILICVLQWLSNLVLDSHKIYSRYFKN
jgi:hypothetical protein